MIYRFLSIFSILGLIGYLFLFDQEYQAFNKEHDTLNKEHDTLNKEHDTLNKEHDTLNKEYDTLFKKANSITKVSINNINHINNLYKEISFCQTTPKILGNESFDQPIPVFYQENYKQEFVIKNSDTLLSFFVIPDLNLKNSSGGVNISSNGTSVSFTISKNKLNKEITAYDFLTLMVDKKSNICKKPMRIYLSSSSNKKEHIGIFGKVGTKNGRFTLPYGTDIDQEKQTILVTDCINNIVQEFDFHGNLIMTIDNKDNHGFGRPVDVKLKNNKIYVVDELKHRVSVFSRDGDHIASYGSRKRLDQNIKYSGQIEDEPFFNLPLGIAVNNSGEMFVVDYGNNRVVKLTAEGKVSKIIGYQVKFNGIGFRGPYHIDINDSLRRVYVVDRDNNRVVVFNMNGDFLFTFGEKGDNHGEFDFPHEIDVSDKDGKIYIADTNNKRIQVFSNSGEYLDKIQIQSGYANPKTVASSSSGLLISGHLGVDAYMVLWKNPTVNYSSRGELSLHSNQNYDTITHNKTYDKFCSSCHMEGSLGAPRFGIESEWQRFPQDINVLLNLVKAGRGSMLKKGGCDLCTDKDLIDAISSMLPSKWASVKN